MRTNGFSFLIDGSSNWEEKWKRDEGRRGEREGSTHGWLNVFAIELFFASHFRVKIVFCSFLNGSIERCATRGETRDEGETREEREKREREKRIVDWWKATAGEFVFSQCRSLIDL